MSLQAYFLTGLLVFICSVLFNIIFNGKRMEWRQGQVVGLLLVLVLSLFFWPFYLICFLYGLTQRRTFIIKR
jgi:hypothetical protein